jgi:4-amino-4-deoxy-L-arabinose transferase-like glycosyltransferase
MDVSLRLTPQPTRKAPRLARFAPVGLALLVLFASASLLLPGIQSGIWDPYELRSIELARRIAVGLFHAEDLALEGIANTLPSRGEVDRGELPFTSMAFALRLFGLHAWAARLALGAWALAGLLATYLAVSRLVDRRAAVCSVLALATMPLYFLHARTLLGDAVTMAAMAFALAGFTLGLFDRGSLVLRSGFVLLGVLGVVSGVLSRGLLLGVVAPVLGPALAWFALRLNRGALRDRFADALALTLLLVGLSAAIAGGVFLLKAQELPERYFAWLGFGVSGAATEVTFDVMVSQLGHALFPWSAFLPVAFARVLLPPAVADAAGRERESGLRLSAAFVVTLAAFAWGAVAPSAGALPFGAVAALAVIAALSLHDLDRGAPASRVAAGLVATFALLFFLDFRNLPEKLLTPFAVEGARFPESFQAAGQHWLLSGTLLATLTVVLAFLEKEDDATARPKPFAPDDYLTWLRTIRDLWNGNLLFGCCVIEAALLGFFAFAELGERFPNFQRFAASGEMSRMFARVAWTLIPLVLAAPLALLLGRDLLRASFRLERFPRLGAFVPRRGSLAAVGLVACGSGLSFGYYPALAAQLSPQQTFDAFLRLARPGEPLGMLGGSSTTAPYTAGRSVESFDDGEAAYRWLMQPGQRRWLVMRADSLASLNSRHRARTDPRQNLPVLEAHSSEILLASNRLLPGETNQNPLDRYLLAADPRPRHVLDANLGEQLDVLGWDVTDLDGQPVDAVRVGRRFEFVIYYRVTARVTGSWQTFVHIDGFQRRFNADHETLGGRYPFSFWKVGDVVADRHTFVLEPNFGAGTYRVFFGLYSGSRRMPVRRGENTDDRIAAGAITIE